MVKIDVSSLLSKEMNRKEFLQTIGIAMLSIAGLGAILKGLSALGGNEPHHPDSLRGYGSASYGGK